MNFESPKWGRGALDADAVGEEILRARRRRNIIIAVIAAAVVLIAALVFVGGGKKPAAGPGGLTAKQNAAASPRVTVIVPGRQQVARVINATGTIAARRDMPVGVSGEGGTVVRVLAEPGQWVGAGQTLAVIERSVQAQQAAQLVAQIEVARADARLAQSNLDRAQTLVSRGFVSKADLEQKRATRDAAAARVRVAEAQLGETRARIGRLDVRAPAAGLVLSRSVEAGQVVGPGAGALFRIADGGQMEVQARLAEDDLANIRIGSAATVTPVGTNLQVAGQVWQVSPVVDPASRQGIARVAIAYRQEIRPGAFASVALTSGTADLPLLPQSAVLSDDKGNFVYVVGRDNKVQRRDVKIGEVNDQGASIVAGLSGNETVVASAGAFLNPGDKIVPRREAARR
ncbi:MAG: HlyD family secretion protein [Sphingomonadales bacterium]|jgi:RND family efflux transporter MFP subunit|nr:HlyD family secretion protein [Sphingomonadales bacterium]